MKKTMPEELPKGAAKPKSEPAQPWLVLTGTSQESNPKPDTAHEGANEGKEEAKEAAPAPEEAKEADPAPTEEVKEDPAEENAAKSTSCALLTDVNKLLSSVCGIARAAGAEQLKIYNEDIEDFKVKVKTDPKGVESPLTKADLKANEVICKMLTELDSSIPIITEEVEMPPYEERKDYEYFWCIDPLDGTKEFIKRNGQFTVNIGLIHRDTPVFGVVYVPVQDLMYYGCTVDGYGAFKKESIDAEPKAIKVASFSKKDVGLTVVASASHRNKETNDFIEKFKDAKCKALGSSLKLLLVAEGEAHVYPRLAPTCEWDTAASHAVVSAAGGSVVQADVNWETYENGRPKGLKPNPDGGKPLVYNKPNELNPYFIVWGNCTDLKSEE